MPIGGLADHRPGRRRRVASVLLWDRDAEDSFGVVTADNFGLFVNLVLIVGRPADGGVLVADHRARSAAGRRVLRDDAVRDRRHDADGAGDRPAGDLPGARDDVDRGLRADRHPARSAASTEAAFKYFLLGAFASSFFLYGIAFLYGVTGTTNIDSCRTTIAAQSMSGNPMILLATGPADRRLRVQDRRRAVPHVVARRLRRRAGGGHRLHVDRRQGGGDRGVRARVPVRASSR